MTYAVFFNVCRTFGSLPHVVILQRLRLRGVQAILYHFLKSFRQRRSFVARACRATSSSRVMTQGVPKDNVLSPLLFNAMMAGSCGYLRLRHRSAVRRRVLEGYDKSRQAQRSAHRCAILPCWLHSHCPTCNHCTPTSKPERRNSYSKFYAPLRGEENAACPTVDTSSWSATLMIVIPGAVSETLASGRRLILTPQKLGGPS